MVVQDHISAFLRITQSHHLEHILITCGEFVLIINIFQKRSCIGWCKLHYHVDSIVVAVVVDVDDLWSICFVKLFCFSEHPALQHLSVLLCPTLRRKLDYTYCSGILYFK